MASYQFVSQTKNKFKRTTYLIIAILASVLLTVILAFPVFADAPANGEVIEGESVPGLKLGDTRAQVEAVYGGPVHCQDVEVGGDLAWCSYPAEGGSNVSVWYQGADGRYASNSSDDTAYRIQWPQALSDWVTTAGINTELAFNDRQAVVDAYPNAKVTYNDNGTIIKVEDLQLGIRVRWSEPVYIFPGGSVSMDIFTPAAALADGSSIHVADIDVKGEKIKGLRPVRVTVLVQGEQGQPVYGATVVGTWTYPSGTTETIGKVTSFTGYAFYGLYDARTKNWTFSIDDVLLDGHPLDRDNSVLSVTFNGKDFK